MAGLKKIKASTLLEVLIASVLLVFVFGMTVMLLNNFAFTKIQKDLSVEQYEIDKCMYRWKHRSFQLPFRKRVGDFEIFVQNENDRTFFEAIRWKTNTVVIRKTQIDARD